MAGLDTDLQWVRPVSSEGHGTLFAHHCGGRFPALLEVVEFESEKPVPSNTHPEDVLLRPTTWSTVYRLGPERALKILEGCTVSGPELFGGGGKALRVEAVEKEGVASSLALVAADSARFLSAEGRARVKFELGGKGYDLPLTDFEVSPTLIQHEGETSSADLGLPVPGRVFLTISLGEAFEGWHWKLAAAVMVFPVGAVTVDTPRPAEALEPESWPELAESDPEAVRPLLAEMPADLRRALAFLAQTPGRRMIYREIEAEFGWPGRTFGPLFGRWKLSAKRGTYSPRPFHLCSRQQSPRGAWEVWLDEDQAAAVLDEQVDLRGED